MRSNEVFSRMSPAEAVQFLTTLKADAKPVAALALNAACQAFKLRPEYIRRQPKEKQADWMRKALGRRIGAPLAEEILATYFLEHELDMLVELLDALGLEHEEGALKEEKPACPSPDVLARVVDAFRKGEKPEIREVLLVAFAAQSGIDWPELEQMLPAREPM